MEQRPGGANGQDVNAEREPSPPSRFAPASQDRSRGQAQHTTLDVFGEGALTVEHRQGRHGDFFTAVKTYYSEKDREFKTFELTIGGRKALEEFGHVVDAARFFANKEKLDQMERESARQSSGMKP